jgi:hypothetical protein
MKSIIFSILFSLAICTFAFAQTAPSASTLAAPQPLPTVAASPVSAILMASTSSQTWTPGPLKVSVGTVVSFILLPCGTPYPGTLTVKVNGKDLSFSSGNALSFTADTAGVWNVALDMNGFFSNIVTVTAR